MINMLLAILTVLVDILVDTAKKLIGLAFLLSLLTISSIITLILVLDQAIG